MAKPTTAEYVRDCRIASCSAEGNRKKLLPAPAKLLVRPSATGSASRVAGGKPRPTTRFHKPWANSWAAELRFASSRFDTGFHALF